MMPKFSIAIIDNDPLVVFATRHMCKSILEDSYVITYKNPIEFFTHLKNGDVAMPDIILCDYDIPVMNGLEVYDTLKKYINEKKPTFYLCSIDLNIVRYELYFNSDYFCGSLSKSLELDVPFKVINLKLHSTAS